MAITFDETSYDNIRGLIRIGLTKAELPDLTIGLDVYEGESIRMVNRYLTTEQIEAQPDDVKAAAMFYCASLLVSAVSQVEQESIAGGEMKWKAYDPTKRAKELEARGNEAVESVKRLTADQNNNPTKLMPQFFGLAKSGKGRGRLW